MSEQSDWIFYGKLTIRRKTNTNLDEIAVSTTVLEQLESNSDFLDPIMSNK